MRNWVPVLLCCCLASPAWAGGGLDQALQLTKEMKYAQALKLADRALKDSGSGPEDVRQAYQVVGLCLAAEGKTKGSISAFKMLLALEPDFRLSDDISPKLSAPFDDALKASAKVKQLVLQHEPPAPSKAGVELVARLGSNPYKMVRGVRLRFRPAGGKEQVQTVVVKGRRPVAFKLPAKLPDGEVNYYFEAVNAHGAALVRAGSLDQPFAIALGAGAVVVAAAGGETGGGETGGGETGGGETGGGETGGGETGGGTGGGGNLVLDAGGDTTAADITAPAPPPPGEDDDGRAVWYKTWWFWTGVGVVVAAGAATGIALAVTSGGGGMPVYDVHLQ